MTLDKVYQRTVAIYFVISPPKNELERVNCIKNIEYPGLTCMQCDMISQVELCCIKEVGERTEEEVKPP